MHYSILVQGSPRNGSFTWINLFKYRNPTITSITVLFRPKRIIASPLSTFLSVIAECLCMHIVVQDPSLVVCASHEYLGLFLRADIEGLVVDALEAAFDHCIFLLLGLNNTLVQIDVLHTHSLSIDHDVARNSLCCIVYHMLLINQAVHLWSQSNKLRDAMSVVLILEDGSRQLLVEVEERLNEGNLLLSTSCS